MWVFFFSVPCSVPAGILFDTLALANLYTTDATFSLVNYRHGSHGILAELWT